jgi:hypothetical protein
MGEDLLPVPFRHRLRPPHTHGLNCKDAIRVRSGSCPDLIRDEEVVGSNPATPTVKYQVKGLIRTADQALEWFPGSVWAEGTRACAFANPAP